MRLWPRRRKAGSVTFTLAIDTSGWDEAMRKVAVAAQQLSDSMRRFRLRHLPSLPPTPHTFTADFDLRCTSPGCNLLPEEH